MIFENGASRQPSWLTPAQAGLVAALGVIAVFVDGRPDSFARDAPWELRLTAVVIVVALCLAEVLGARLPGPVLLVAVSVPAAWLNVVRDGALSFVFVAAALTSVALTRTQQASLVALGIALVATAVSYLLNTDPEGWLGYTVAMCVVWFAMRSVVRQQELVEELRATQASLAREAQANERRRIAREIHDVAAHTLAVTMLQLTGVRLLLQRIGGDARAIQALGEAERLGRQGLDDVRRTVGLLADSERSPGTDVVTPLPGAADIERLVGDYRLAGQEVELEIRGDLTSVPPAAGLALFRIVQEALANVARHAPGAAARVELDAGEATTRLRVTNTRARGDASPVRSAGGSGLGLLGMRERAALLDGTLEAGPDDGGWRVECALPLRRGSPKAATVAQ